VGGDCRKERRQLIDAMEKGEPWGRCGSKGGKVLQSLSIEREGLREKYPGSRHLWGGAIRRDPSFRCCFKKEGRFEEKKAKSEESAFSTRGCPI